MTPASKSWRDVLPVHPAAELFPMMTEDELIELGNDIKANGLLQPIVLWSQTRANREIFLLDGRNRLAAMEAVGIPIVGTGNSPRNNFRILSGEKSGCQSTEGIKLDEQDPYEYVISANLHRRHLTSEQKRDLIAKLLAANPEKSNRQIAAVVGQDHKTIAVVRAEAEARGEIPHVETITDTKGRKQPASKARLAKVSRSRRTTEEIRFDRLLEAMQFVACTCETFCQVDLPERLTAAQVNRAIEQLEEAEGYLREAKAKISALLHREAAQS
jgi:hypothetical protein